MKSKYGKITSQTIEELRTIAGGSNVSTDKSELEGYSYDETPDRQHIYPDLRKK